jgi:flagellar biosynthesis/type III secretory pathway protein FliH
MGVLTDATQHRYQTCRDESCERFPCRVFREGYREGYEDGHAGGYAAGHAAGYADGYAAGAASASKGG